MGTTGVDNYAFNYNKTDTVKSRKSEVRGETQRVQTPWYRRRLTIVLACVIIVVTIILTVTILFATRSGMEIFRNATYNKAQ